MKALILRQNGAAATAISRQLLEQGYQILCVETQASAHALIRLEPIDLIVMDERIEGQLTHAIALSAERKNPQVGAIMITDRGSDETDDLFDLIPALYAQVGGEVGPSVIAELAEAAMVAPISAHAAEAVEEVDEITEIEDIQLRTQTSQPLVPISYADIAIAGPAMAELLTDPEEEAEMGADAMDAAARAQIAAILRNRIPMRNGLGELAKSAMAAE